MNEKSIVMLGIAVLTVLLAVVGLGQTLAGDWSTVAEQVALPIVLIAFVGIITAVALGRR